MKSLLLLTTFTISLAACTTPQASSPPLTPVAKVRAIIGNPKEHTVLLGLTRDAHKWGTPGGAVESGEDAETAALREIAEETGLQKSDFIAFKVLLHDTERKTVVFAFCIKPGATRVPTIAGDYDQEFSELAWLKADALPDNTYPDAVERAKLFFAENEKSSFCLH